MSELKITDFKYGDWRDWFLDKKKRWELVEKSRLFVTINNKELSIIAPVNISEITISYLHQSGEAQFLNGFGYMSYSTNYRRSSTNNYSDKLEITIEFISFEYVNSKFANRKRIC